MCWAWTDFVIFMFNRMLGVLKCVCYAFWATWKRFMLQNSRTDNFSFFSASHLYVRSGVFCAYSVHNIRWLGDVSALPFSVLKTIYCIFFQITLHISCKFSHSCDYQKQSAPLERKFCGENGRKNRFWWLRSLQHKETRLWIRIRWKSWLKLKMSG